MFRFLKLRKSHLPLILEWRTSPRVTKYMFTDIAKDRVAQEIWFENLTVPHWAIHYGDKPVGVLNVNDRNEWGYYIGDDDALGLGGLVPPYFYNHFFQRRLLLRAEVMEGNEAVMKMHLFHGYKKVGIRVKAVEKNGWAHDVHLFKLTADDWERQAPRYKHYIAEFET